jgi:hypothetical protein
VPGTSLTDVPGAIAIVIVLLLIPVVVIMSGAVASAIIGETYYRTTRQKFADSELVDLPD